MPTTAIKITKDDSSIERAKFMTAQNGTHLDIDVYKCNDEFIPIGDPSMGVSIFKEDEYHIKLRQEAHAKGQYVPEESTNPEWNPEYNAPTSEHTV